MVELFYREDAKTEDEGTEYYRLCSRAFLVTHSFSFNRAYGGMTSRTGYNAPNRFWSCKTLKPKPSVYTRGSVPA